MKNFYLKNIELRNDKEFVKPYFFNDDVFVYFGFEQDTVDDELASFDLKIMSYDYLYDFVDRLGGIFFKDCLLLKKYDEDEIARTVSWKYFDSKQKQSFLAKEYEEHFDEDWDAIEEEMADGIEKMKHSKVFVKDIKVVSSLDFDTENFDEKLKLSIDIFDGNKDIKLDLYLHVRSINNLKQLEKMDSQFFNKCFFVLNYSNDKVQSFLDELKKECKFNTGVKDIKNILKESLIEPNL